MSFMLLGILNAQAAGGVSISYWLSTLGSSQYEEGGSVAVDSAGNAYIAGYTLSGGAGANEGVLAKYLPDGSIAWQRFLGGTNDDILRSITVDSSDNVYVSGRTKSVDPGNVDFLLAKYNSSGTIQWQRILQGGSADDANSVKVDSSGNVYIGGQTQSTGAGQIDFLLAKYNSSGTIQWQKVLGSSREELLYGIAFDTSDNVYVVGSGNSGPGALESVLAKYNSSGTIQWQRKLGGSGTGSATGYDIVIDGSNNIYIVGDERYSGTPKMLLAKYNSSGTIQWQRSLGATDNDAGRGIALDSLGNVYLCGYSVNVGAGNNDFVIAKYNSSGTIQWQRTLGATSSDTGFSIAVDLLDNLFAFGSTGSTGAGSNDFLLAHLPNDGSLTGTYTLDGVSMVYAASGLSATTTAFASNASSYTDSTSSLTSSTSALASATAYLTTHLVVI